MRSRSGSAATRSGSSSSWRRRRSREGADTLITTGGIQSNHARATAAVAARLGLGCVLVANGAPPEKPTANALLDRLLGAEVRYVGVARGARAGDGGSRRGAARAGADARSSFRSARPRRSAPPPTRWRSTELLAQIPAPDLIVLSTSSGGTQAGIVAGCALHGLSTRVVGISADDPAAAIAGEIRRILERPRGAARRAAGRARRTRRSRSTTRFVGDGYGVPTPQSTRGDRAVRAGARRCFSIRPTRRRRWPGSSRGVARARVLAHGHGALLAHRRTGGAVRMISHHVSRRGADGDRLEVPRRVATARASWWTPGSSRG